MVFGWKLCQIKSLLNKVTEQCEVAVFTLAFCLEQRCSSATKDLVYVFLLSVCKGHNSCMLSVFKLLHCLGPDQERRYLLPVCPGQGSLRRTQLLFCYLISSSQKASLFLFKAWRRFIISIVLTMLPQALYDFLNQINRICSRNCY